MDTCLGKAAFKEREETFRFFSSISRTNQTFRLRIPDCGFEIPELLAKDFPGFFTDRLIFAARFGTY